MELSQQPGHARRLHLEDARGVASLQQPEDQRVVERGVVDVRLFLPVVADMGQAVLDDRQVAQAEEVHLQQADLLHDVLLVLGHDFAVGIGALQRHVVDEGLAPDHDAGGVDRVLAAQALELAGRLDHLCRDLVLLEGLPQLGGVGIGVVAAAVARPLDVAVEAGLEGGVLAEDGGRVHLRQAVADRVRQAQHPGGVPERLLRLDGREGDDLGHPVLAVALGDVADDLAAATLVEVDVDVGHLLAAGVEEALEAEPPADRVDLGDAEGVRHHRPPDGAPARSHPDALGLRPLHEVRHDEEVAGEAHLLDDRELVAHPLLDLVGDLGIAPADPLLGHLVEVARQRLALGHLEVGDERVVQRDLDVAELRHHQRVLDRLRVLREGEVHLLPALQVELVGVEAHPVGVGELLARLDAEQDVVGTGVVLLAVVGVVGGHDRDPQLPPDLGDLHVEGRLLGEALVLDLEEVPVAEDLPVLGCHPAGLIRLAGDEILLELARQASRQDDDPIVVLGEQFPVHPRTPGPGVVALEERQRRELHEVAVPGGVGREHRQVMVGGLPVSRPVEAALGCDVGFDADDGLDAGGPALQVEGDGPVHDAVVGEPDRRHPELLRPGEHLGDAAGPVEHRVLRVGVEMHEAQSPGPPQIFRENDTAVT